MILVVILTLTDSLIESKLINIISLNNVTPLFVKQSKRSRINKLFKIKNSGKGCGLSDFSSANKAGRPRNLVPK